MLVTVEKVVQTQSTLKSRKKRKKTRSKGENEPTTSDIKSDKNEPGQQQTSKPNNVSGEESGSSEEYYLEYRVDEKATVKQDIYDQSNSDASDRELIQVGNETTQTPKPTRLAYFLPRINTPETKSLNERIMNEMERTNKYNDLVFDKQKYTSSPLPTVDDESEDKLESRVPQRSILKDFHMTFLEPGERSRQPVDENDRGCFLSRQIAEHSSGLSSDDWDSFCDFLNRILDIYSYRDSNLFIDEFRRLEAYLLAEQNENDENPGFFENQRQIVDHLNDLIKVKQFQLSQSKALFETTKRNFFELLEAKLSRTNLNECLARFDKYSQNYFYLFDQIKAKLKLKMSKYENYLKLWNEFDAGCDDLDRLFAEVKGKRITSNLKYRSKVMELENSLNRLKTRMCSCASVVHENKYFDFKKKIIKYEVDLKNFRDLNETDPDEPSNTIDIKIDRHVYKEDHTRDLKYSPQSTSKPIMMNFADLTDLQYSPEVPIERARLSPYRPRPSPASVTPIKIERMTPPSYDDYLVQPHSEERVMFHSGEFVTRPFSKRPHDHERPVVYRRVETSDKSTATINDCATQTDMFRNVLDVDSVVEINKHTYADTSPVKSSSASAAELDHHHVHHSLPAACSRETEGKKLLLEAYLRTNDNLAMIHQQQKTKNDKSASSSSTNQTHSGGKKGHLPDASSKMTTTTRESGIGTATTNDDEVDSSPHQSIYAEDDDDDHYIYKRNKLPVVEENVEPATRRRKTKSAKKQPQQQLQQSKSLVDESSSIKKIKLLPLKNQANVAVSSSSCSTLGIDVDTKFRPKLADKANKKAANQDTSKKPSVAAKQVSAFRRFLQYLMLFLIPLFFIILVYFIYMYFLNPSCCDFKRNYLFINIS